MAGEMQTIGNALIQQGMNAVLPGSGTVMGAMGMGAYKPPRQPDSYGQMPDANSMVGIDRFEYMKHTAPTSAPGTQSVKIYLNDGTERIMENVALNSGSAGSFQRSDNYYDPTSNSIVSKPKDDGSWDFSQVDPRTGKLPPNRYGTRYGSGTGFGVFDAPEQQQTPSGSNPLQGVTTAGQSASAVGEQASRGKSPITGQDFSASYLPQITHKPI